MQTKTELNFKTYNVGVIVGRFQVAELTKGHRDLIQSVCDRHETVYIFLGVKMSNELTITDPLPFAARAEMIQTEFPNIKVLYIKDRYNDIEWVENLDDQISTIITSFDKVTLYGSRDSFVDCYKSNNGKYNVEELVPTEMVSGTAARHDIARQTINDVNFRKGIIYAVMRK